MLCIVFKIADANGWWDLNMGYKEIVKKEDVQLFILYPTLSKLTQIFKRTSMNVHALVPYALCWL